MSSSPNKPRHSRQKSNTERELLHIMMKEKELREIIRGEKPEPVAGYGGALYVPVPNLPLPPHFHHLVNITKYRFHV